jgi:hypothetical protein
MDIYREAVNTGAQIITGAAIDVNPYAAGIRSKSATMETLPLESEHNKPPPTPAIGFGHQTAVTMVSFGREESSIDDKDLFIISRPPEKLSRLPVDEPIGTTFFLFFKGGEVTKNGLDSLVDHLEDGAPFLIMGRITMIEELSHGRQGHFKVGIPADGPTFNFPQTIHDIGIVPFCDSFSDIFKQEFGALEFEKLGYIKPVLFLLLHHVIDASRQIGNLILRDCDLSPEFISTGQTSLQLSRSLILQVENK